MGTLTIRNLDEAAKRKLRGRAAARGVSMEQEARRILAEGLRDLPPATGRKLTVEEILAFGRRLPKIDFDQKQVSDELWSSVEKD